MSTRLEPARQLLCSQLRHSEECDSPRRFVPAGVQPARELLRPELMCAAAMLPADRPVAVGAERTPGVVSRDYSRRYHYTPSPVGRGLG